METTAQHAIQIQAACTVTQGFIWPAIKFVSLVLRTASIVLMGAVVICAKDAISMTDRNAAVNIRVDAIFIIIMQWIRLEMHLEVENQRAQQMDRQLGAAARV